MNINKKYVYFYNLSTLESSFIHEIYKIQHFKFSEVFSQ